MAASDYSRTSMIRKRILSLLRNTIAPLPVCYIKFIEFEQAEANLYKVERHQIDLLFDTVSKRYWVNETSPNGYIVEKLLIAAYANAADTLQKILVEGDEVRYIDC